MLAAEPVNESNRSSERLDASDVASKNEIVNVVRPLICLD